MSASTFDRAAWHRRVIGTDKRDLTAAQKIVLFALATFADYRDGTNAHPGDDLLAEMCGYTPTAVGTAVRRGRELGLIERTTPANRKGGKAAIYRLIFTPTVVGVKSSLYPNADAVFTPTATRFLPQPPLGSPTQVPTHSPGGLRKSGTSLRAGACSDHPTPHPLTANSDSEPANAATAPPGGIGIGEEPPRLCPEHAHWTGRVPSCIRCRDSREAHERWQANKRAAAEAAKAAEKAAKDHCRECDEGWVIGRDGKPIDPARRCKHPKLLQQFVS